MQQAKKMAKGGDIERYDVDFYDDKNAKRDTLDNAFNRDDVVGKAIKRAKS